MIILCYYLAKYDRERKGDHMGKFFRSIIAFFADLYEEPMRPVSEEARYKLRQRGYDQSQYRRF